MKTLLSVYVYLKWGRFTFIDFLNGNIHIDIKAESICIDLWVWGTDIPVICGGGIYIDIYDGIYIDFWDG